MRFYQSFPTAIPLYEAGYPRVTHPSAAQSPKNSSEESFLSASLDLHVLSTPPAFILSQDQTLNKNFVFVFAVFVECTCKHARSPHYSRKLILIQFKINILANLSLLLFYKVSSLNACFRKTKFSGRYSSFLESFKVVSLFNYQGSLLLFSSAATFISYHCFLSLSTTFLFIFQSFD